MAATETQAEAAQRMYSARATAYEDSWHPEYSKRFIELVPLKPGQRVLDLCCGTGLEAFLAANVVGEHGHIVCVDITENMYAEAQNTYGDGIPFSSAGGRPRKQARDLVLGPRLSFIRHDVTDLSGNAAIQKDNFDVILCSNAFVLFGKPSEIIKGWRDYLKPGGVLVVDVPHEMNMRSGLFIEGVAKRMGVSLPWSRSWVRSRDSLRDILENEGFAVDNVVELEKISGERSTYYTVEQADEQFDYVSKPAFNMQLMTDDFKEQARDVFKDEFEKAAVDGKVEVVDSLYVYVARKV